LGVFLNEQINDLIDARGSYRVLALIRLNSALAQGEVISQYDTSDSSNCRRCVLRARFRAARTPFCTRNTVTLLPRFFSDIAVSARNEVSGESNGSRDSMNT